jgi:hypothetical protein
MRFRNVAVGPRHGRRPPVRACGVPRALAVVWGPPIEARPRRNRLPHGSRATRPALGGTLCSSGSPPVDAAFLRGPPPQAGMIRTNGIRGYGRLRALRPLTHTRLLPIGRGRAGSAGSRGCDRNAVARIVLPPALRPSPRRIRLRPACRRCPGRMLPPAPRRARGPVATSCSAGSRKGGGPWAAAGIRRRTVRPSPIDWRRSGDRL